MWKKASNKQLNYLIFYLPVEIREGGQRFYDDVQDNIAFWFSGLIWKDVSGQE